MAENDSTPRQKLVMQLLLFVVGASLVLSRNHWSKPLPVLLAGFFNNLGWITLILGHNFKIWSCLRNSLAGNLAAWYHRF